MLQVIKTIRCDLTSNTPAVVEAMAGDKQSRVVACSLYEGYDALIPPEGTTGMVAYTDPVGVRSSYDTLPDGSPAVAIMGNIAAVTLSEGLLAKAGSVCVSVILRDSEGAQLSTFPFRVSVTAAPGITGVENLPGMGSSFEGMIFYGGPGGVVMPLRPGAGLKIQDDTLSASGGSGGLTVTDDGQGHVSILPGGQSSIQDDGAGHIKFL